MWKLIFLALIVWLVVTIAKRMLANTNSAQSAQAPAADETSKQKTESHTAENMVQCSSCKVHLPRSEAFLVAGKYYCSHAHIERKPD